MEIPNLQDTLKWLLPYFEFLPYNWLTWPDILTHLIIPFGFNWYAMYGILDRLRIFGPGSITNKVLATVLAFVLIPIAPLAALASAGFIGLVMMEGWKKKLLFLIGVIILFFFLIPLLYTTKVY